jgi:UDP:flavonoid glycosyltransferase YjiC (YdhE family)
MVAFKRIPLKIPDSLARRRGVTGRRALARIVLNTFGSYGDVFPYLAIGQRLQKHGHDPVIAAPETYRSASEDAGLEFFPVGPEVDYEDADTFRRVMDQKRGAEVVVREILVPHLRESYRQLEIACEGSDLLVSHVLTYAAPILGEKRRIPWVSTTLSPMSFVSAYDPPALAPIPWFAWLRPLGPTFVGTLWRILKRFSLGWSEPIRTFRQELGLEPGGDHLWGNFSSAYGVLALYSDVFAPPQPDWPELTTVCGFPFYDRDFGGSGDSGRVERFLTEGPAPLVFSLGSSAIHCAGNFYELAVEATKRLHQRAVLVIGDSAPPPDLPDGVLAIRSAAVRPLFEGASVVVHAGGVGTVGQAMRSGRPQLVVPFAHDHFDNARRVKRLGIGGSLSRTRLTATKLARYVGAIAANDDIRASAASLGKIIHAEDGAEAACKALEELLGVSTRSAADS